MYQPLYLLLLLSLSFIPAHSFASDPGTPADSARIAELDQYWAALATTVREGDFEGYAALYHPDAVVVFATRADKVSQPISAALAGWKQGFLDTQAGTSRGEVSFRLSQRIGDASTAHETGIFQYTSADSEGKVLTTYLVHFEILLVKQHDAWRALMEYQKAQATEAEWEALK